MHKKRGQLMRGLKKRNLESVNLVSLIFCVRDGNLSAGRVRLSSDLKFGKVKVR